MDKIDFDAKTDVDLLVSVPGALQSTGDRALSTVELAKSYLASPEGRIRLHDLVLELTRDALHKTSNEEFPLNGKWSVDELSNRLEKFIKTTEEICLTQMLIGYWGEEHHRDIALLPLKKSLARIGLDGGQRPWLKMRSYPSVLFLYSFGLGAVAGQRYTLLLSILHARISDPDQQGATTSVAQSLVTTVSDLSEWFARLPDRDRQYVPVSEYLFKELQPIADDILFAGSEYEALFDRLEILVMLECAFLRKSPYGQFGRFGWKHASRRGIDPLSEMLDEAESRGNSWAVIQAGFFGGSIDNFRKTAGEYGEMVKRRVR